MKRILKILLVIFSGFFLIGVAFFVWLAAISGDLGDFLLYYGNLAGGSKNYLIVFQNNNELRPTGGFISAVGLMKFQNGLPKSFEIKDVYQYGVPIPYEKPPYPMQEILAPENKDFSFSFRDGNFYPNFADSAEVLEELYRTGGNQENIDGIIAMNFSTLEDLLELVGPINADGVSIDKDNLFQTIEFNVNNVDRHSIQDLNQRKSILKALANEVSAKIIRNPGYWPEVLQTINRELDEKNIQTFFKDSKLHEFAVKQGWSGEWTKPECDVLGINEANLSTFKVNRYVTKEVNYLVKFVENDGKLSATADLTIKFSHFGDNNNPTSGIYGGYLRAYSPYGSKLISASSQTIFAEDKNKYYQIFGYIFHIQPQTEDVIHIRYQLPDAVISGNTYNLYVPKQSGTKDYYSIRIELPRKYNIKSDSFSAHENYALYEGIPKKDINFSLKFDPETNPPFIIFQEIMALDEVKLVFSEPMDQTTALDKNNYSIDGLQILEVTNEPGTNSIILKVSGMTEKWEQKYVLKLSNIKDADGNAIEPNPRKITLIQRLKNNQWTGQSSS